MNQISVVVPIYNMELYLEECLESIVNQTEDFYEIILVNDGSTDKSREICDNYCKNYSNIKLISQENRGLGAARNIGASKATGNYIIFVDSDDYISLDMNQKINEVLNDNMVDVLYFNADIQYDIKTDESANAFRHTKDLNGQVMSGMDYLRKAFPDDYVVCAWIAVFKREFLKKNNICFPEGIYYEDNYFMLQTVTSAEAVLCIPDSLYIRRCRENSIMTSKINEKKCSDIVTNQILLWDFLLKNYRWRLERNLLRRFVAYYILGSYFNISKYQNKDIVEAQEEIITRTFLDKCLFLFIDEDLKWDESLAFIIILIKIRKLDSLKNKSIIEKYFGSNDQYTINYKRAIASLEMKFLRKIFALPLNRDNVKVGFYGIGNHSVDFIHLYQKRVGDIKCDLFFIVTLCGSTPVFFNRPVIAYDKVPQNADCIILSSKPYQQEMKDMLLLQGVDEKKIVLLYEKNDICDLIMVNWVLNQIA